MSRLSRLVSLSLESEAVIGDEEALNDASVHTDIVTDVEMPAQEINNTVDEMSEAEAEANSLQNTADMINETTESGGQGVDPLAAELVQEKIEAAIEKYQLSVYTKTLSRESFNTASSRREVSRQLAREAEEASKGIWQRIKDAFHAIIKAVKEFFNRWLTQRGRLHARVKALKEKYSKAETEVNASRVDMSAQRLGSTDLNDEVDKLVKFVKSSPENWFKFYKLADGFDYKIEIDVFEACGGSLGGKKLSISNHFDEENIKNDKAVSAKVDEIPLTNKEAKLEGVTKEGGKKILDKLDSALGEYRKFEKLAKEFIDENIKYTKESVSDTDLGFITKMKLKRSVSSGYNKVLSTVLSTYMRVASVATEVCAKSIGPAKKD